jgi:stage III sporulation protein AG
MTNKKELSLTEKNKKILIALGLFAGVILIIVSFFMSGSNGGNKTNQSNMNAHNNLSRTDTVAYVAEQEKKLCEILKRIDGVSEPFVMIVLESSSEYIYATKQSIKESSSKNGETTQKDVQKEIILYEDEKKAKSPILVKEIKPKIKGVAVVCRGISGDDMRLKIINLVSTALNLPANRVYVTSAD